jgi:hypothetical protein
MNTTSRNTVTSRKPTQQPPDNAQSNQANQRRNPNRFSMIYAIIGVLALVQIVALAFSLQGKSKSPLY